MWATAGLLVAAFWALFAAASSVSSGDSIRNAWALVCLTCPVAIAGMHHSISLYQSLVANAATYVALGLAVETLRKQLQHSQ